MINVSVARSCAGDVQALRLHNHGDPVVCAAVSALVLNAVNSIDALTDERFTCNYNEQGGFLEIEFQNEAGKLGRDARLLTESLMLGLRSIAQEYPGDISITAVPLDTNKEATP
ncbi:MAG: ribosomal-processing cysteine protease Prp [Defluviitaleaceae bacterium]|nr:ribosomal-processing cysteine protease Prp [Defluviitaleaceae bacterium]